MQRIKIPTLLKDEWFKKGYKPPTFTEEEDVNVDDVAAAFDDSKVLCFFFSQVTNLYGVCFRNNPVRCLNFTYLK